MRGGGPAGFLVDHGRSAGADTPAEQEPVADDAGEEHEEGETRTQKVNLWEYIGERKRVADPASRSSILDWLRGEIGKLVEQKDAADLEKLAAYRWAFDYLRFPAVARSGGGNTLAVKATDNGIDVQGRPNFQGEAAGMPFGSGEARRHIIAWHTIQAAMASLINRIMAVDPDAAERLQEKLLGLIKGREPEKKEEKPARAGKAKAVTPPPATPLAQAADRLLRVMNSNPHNLWAGPGYENSLINTYQMAIGRWIEQFDEIIQTTKGKRARKSMRRSTPGALRSSSACRPS